MSASGPIVSLGQRYLLVDQQMSISADGSFYDGGGTCFDLSADDGGFGGSWDSNPQSIGDATSGGACPTNLFFVYTAPSMAGVVTMTFTHAGDAPVTYDNGQTVYVYAFTFPCAVSYAANVTPSGQVTITLSTTDDSGGATWAVEFSDGGAGGSFNPPSAEISDATGGGATTIQTIYTAPAAPRTVIFDFHSTVSGGGSILDFQYSPASLSVAAGGSKDAAFMSFE